MVDSQIQVPLAELRFSASRASGPGGQNVNKVNSKVTLHWNVRHSPALSDDVRQRFLTVYAHRLTAEGDVVVYSQRYRDQPQNRADCLEKLRQLILAVRHAPKRRRLTRPSRSSRERRLRDKQRKGERKRQRQDPAAGD